ncbi:unnamed protein product [Ectocarpus sp. CCAP 1310/34]|nr:unnamed protein product [Ectocarpus sp. CCAP 1310/34]
MAKLHSTPIGSESRSSRPPTNYSPIIGSWNYSLVSRRFTGGRSHASQTLDVIKTIMLNDKQKHDVIDAVNVDFDIPLLSEGIERRFIENFVDQAVPAMEPSLSALMPPAYVDLVKVALDETLTAAERKECMSALLRGELAVPLSKQLNERVDVSYIPESMEGKVLKVVAEKMVNEIVAAAVKSD